MKKLTFLLTLVVAFSLVACGGKKDEKEAGKETAAKGGSDSPKEEGFKKPELEEKSLEAAGEAFAGWFAQGPKSAKVMGDLGGVRIASQKLDGPDAFDLAWSFRKPDLAQMKENLTKGAEAGKATLTFSADSEEGLEWTMEAGKHKSYHFSLMLKVSDQDVNCYTMPMGAKNAEEAAFLKETCKTIVKK